MGAGRGSRKLACHLRVQKTKDGCRIRIEQNGGIRRKGAKRAGGVRAGGNFPRGVTMKHDYPDIRALTTREPTWYDQDGVPRYLAFDTKLCPDPYARWVVLLQIACQRCCHPFLVEVHGGVWNPEPGPAAGLNYGDPPPHEDRQGQKCWGDTMSSDNLTVVEVWIQDKETLEFERHPDQEGPIAREPGGEAERTGGA